MWQTNLIRLYCAVCDNSSTIEAIMQRQSNNFRPQFSDEECITIYLWGISQRRFEQKAIYEYTKNHLLEWFPKLPSYQAFSDRLNRLAPAFQALAEHWLGLIGVSLQGPMEYIIDSCPIILAKAPVPLSLMAFAAAQHDLPVARQILEDHLGLKSGRLYADKAYVDAVWAEALKKNHALELITPRKKRKGDVLISGDTFSTFVSSIRQPIECFFN